MRRPGKLARIATLRPARFFRQMDLGVAGRIAACMLLPIAIAGCDTGGGKRAAPAQPVPSVVVQTVATKDLVDTSTFTGRIEANGKVEIRARVQGYLKVRNFKEGVEVKKGTLLYLIEPESFEIAVAQAQANAASAEAALKLAEQNFERTKELASRKTASRAQLDTAQSTLAQAQATLQARRAELEAVKLNLSYTRIHAPMDGRIGRSAYSVGNLVGPSSNPLVTLVAQDPIYVTFPVPQRLLLEVRRAGRGPESVYVKLRLSDGSLYEERGEIEFVDVQATASTDSVTVRARIPNPKRILIDQQLVDVLVVRKEPERKLVVSQSALLLDQQGAYVLAIGDGNKVVIKRIATGEQRGPLIVVESGLQAGDRVIVSGHQKARPGAPVNPQTQAEAGAAAAAAAKARSAPTSGGDKQPAAAR